MYILIMGNPKDSNNIIKVEKSRFLDSSDFNYASISEGEKNLIQHLLEVSPVIITPEIPPIAPPDGFEYPAQIGNIKVLHSINDNEYRFLFTENLEIQSFDPLIIREHCQLLNLDEQNFDLTRSRLSIKDVEISKFLELLKDNNTEGSNLSKPQHQVKDQNNLRKSALQEQLRNANELDNKDLKIWRLKTYEVIKYALGGDHEYTQRFSNLDNSLPLEPFRFEEAKAILSAAITNLELNNTDVNSTSYENPTDENRSSEPGIFIVHGQNELIKSETQNFINSITEERPIILHQQSNNGTTLIEKFEKISSKCKFAIVLLTADDEGKSLKDTTYKKRARQNVIYELGFFHGKLGRENVIFMMESEVEIPSDIHGLVYITIDNNNPIRWKLELAKELSSSGFTVNFTNII